MTTKIEKLREEITKSLDHYAMAFEVDGRYSPKQWVEEILQTFTNTGGVMLAENQVLPVAECPYPDDTNTALGFRVGMGKQSRRMINAGWRKVELLK